MKKTFRWVIVTLCVIFALGALAACTPPSTEPAIPDGKVRVSFMDGDTVLSYVDVDKGAKVTAPETDPAKTGFEFVRWCATPSFNIPYDFDTELEENTKIYAGFRSTAADDHTWYVLGESLVSNLFARGWTSLQESNPVQTVDDLVSGITFTKDATQGNKFTFTADFYSGDKFQIVNHVDGWDGQIGNGYFIPAQRTNVSTSNFYGEANPFSDKEKETDIVCGVSGNYTLTLVVDTAGKLTELSYVRNGDAAQLEVQFNYFLKGKNVTKWENRLTAYTQLSANDDKNVYTTTIGLQEGEEFIFVSTEIGDVTNTVKGNINKSVLVLADDAKTAAAVEFGAESWDNNVHVKGGTGTYKLTLTEPDTDGGKITLAAEKTADAVPAYDYYVKGNIGGDTDWTQRRAMTLDADTGLYKWTGAIAKDEKFQVTVAAHGDADKTELINVNTKYVDYVSLPNELDISANDYVVTKADTYTITIDPVNMFVSVKGENSTCTYGVAVKGNITSWGLSEADGQCFEYKSDAQTLVGKITVTLKKDDQIMFQSYNKGDKGKTQIDYAGAVAHGDYTFTGIADELGNKNNNITCLSEAGGTYEFTVTMNANGQFVSVVAAKKAA